MALTLTQEQQLSSVLHFIANETEHHNPTMAGALNFAINIIDPDITSQSGTIYSTPSNPGSLDNLAGPNLGGALGT